MIQKRVLVPDRVRHLPETDWAWVDRRFLRDFAPKLSGDAVFLYYLLIAVSDKCGLSFYGDNSLARILRTPIPQLLQARQELVDWNLIAYDAPLSVFKRRLPSPKGIPQGIRVVSPSCASISSRFAQRISVFTKMHTTSQAKPCKSTGEMLGRSKSATPIARYRYSLRCSAIRE